METIKRTSVFDIINASPDFKFIGNDKNGTPVFELKKPPVCERCGKTADECECEEEFI